ncbi:PQQ-binding-like beta-propeller repeat protein [Haliea sp. E1-2-M8]|uniref:outer membrane protein assembly factor BamB family protein n=1 Tax=Haliea sp. E1-2-M8 TaxID=3064706 RepID=UPI00271F3531|nr:PQQ-binding-like beta-propeller repeat protein [Haliea sp. E1-2-M8]MDO8863320.1 PQQ-binding-like beta-propeller repeat protein [Haliea sp. E1-2-M8]
MKKVLLLILLLSAGLAAWLGSEGFFQHPARTVETLAMRHADKLPLAYFGGRLYQQHCADCHQNPAMKAPTRQALGNLSREGIMVSLEFGKMQPMATHLSKQQRGLIALYLTDSAEGVYDWIDSIACTETDASDRTVRIGHWGLGPDNRRFLSTAEAGIDRGNIGSLELAWSLALPRVTDMRSQPAIIGDTLYLGDRAGMLYALDRKTGCVRRHTEVMAGVRSAITVAELADGRRLLVFADSLANLFALDPETLDIVWQGSARVFDTSVVTGSISFHNDRLYVPVSSYEVAVAGSPDYPCCRSHGAVLALDAGSGKQLWAWHATPDATLQGQNADGVDWYGPSGAVVWTTPAIDPARNRLYVGTGQNLSRPATGTSDAIVALDLDSGEPAWIFQATADDVWNAACQNAGANCPQQPGPDFDFGASVIIADLPDGSQLLLAGQKSGAVHALNPDPASAAGERLWSRRVSQGTTNGGIHWGMGLAGTRLVVPVADPERDLPGYTPAPGLYALDSTSGALEWQHPVSRDCDFPAGHRPLVGLAQVRAGGGQPLAEQYRCSFYYGLSAAATVTPELVFSAGLDGRVRAFDLATGEVLWETATAVPLTASNGLEGHGGAIDVGGQVVADGWLYVLSGYSMFGQLPGNLLLAYRVGQ